MSTYISMFQRIARAASLPAASTDFNNGSDNTAMIKELINESNQINAAIAPARPISTDITLTAGTADYTLPADFGQMNLVNYYQGTRRIEIQPTTKDKLLTLQSVVSNATLFIYYCVRSVTDNSGNISNVMSIYPTPGANGQIVTIDYMSIPASLNTDPSATTDSTKNLVAIAPFENVDKYYALKNIYAVWEQTKQSEYYEERYNEWFKKYTDFLDNKTKNVVVKQGIRTQMNPNLYPTLS